MRKLLLSFLAYIALLIPAFSQHIPDSNHVVSASAGDTIRWVAPYFQSGGHLSLRQQALVTQLFGDTLIWVVPPGLQQGGMLKWQTAQGFIYPITQFYLRFRYHPVNGLPTGYWTGVNSGVPDTLMLPFLSGWRSLSWPRSAGNAPPISSMGSPNIWEFNDTALWIVHDTTGGNFITGPVGTRIRLTGNKDIRVAQGDHFHWEYFPSDTFLIAQTSFSSLLVTSAKPVFFQASKLVTFGNFKLNIPSVQLPDTIISNGNNDLEFSSSGDTLILKHLMHVGKRNRRLSGKWVIKESLQAYDSTTATGSITWAGDSTSFLIGNCMFDQLIVKRGCTLKLNQPLRLKRSGNSGWKQWVMETGSTLETDTATIILEGSPLLFSRGELQANVKLKLKSRSLRQFWPSGSRVKLLHQGNIHLILPDSSSGTLDWPDSTNKQLSSLIIGRNSRWELGSGFSGTHIDSLCQINENASLVLNDNRLLHFPSHSMIRVNGRIETLGNEGLAGSQSGQLRCNIQNLLFSDSAHVLYVGGTQTVSPLSNYPRLTLGNTGVKTLAGNILINGDLSIRGNYTRLDADIYTITIGRSMYVSTTSGNGFTEGQSELVFTHPRAELKVEGFHQSETVNRVRIKSGGSLKLLSGLQIKGSGRLTLENGAILNADTHDLSGTGLLQMLPQSQLWLSKVGSDPLPGLSGIAATYQIDSSAALILNGLGNQKLRGGRVYGILKFQGTGEKTLSSSLTIPPQRVEIGTGVRLKQESWKLGGVATSLKLDSLSYFELNGSGIQPDCGGHWEINPSATVGIFSVGAAATILRKGKTYPNLNFGTGKVQTNKRDTLLLLPGCTLLVDSGCNWSIEDSSSLISNASPLSLDVSGAVTCSHSGGLKGFFQPMLGAPTITLSSGSRIQYLFPSGQQQIDSLNFHHLSFSGNGYKQIPSKLTVKGNIEFPNAFYSIPDTIMLIGQDTQTVRIPLVQNMLVQGKVKQFNNNVMVGGSVIMEAGSQLRGDGNDTLRLGNNGAFWTSDSQSIKMPIQAVYPHPYQTSGWRLLGFPWSLHTQKWGNRLNVLDTLQPKIRGLVSNSSNATWLSLAQKSRIEQKSTDSLNRAPHEAWLLQCGPAGLLQSARDSILISGTNLPVFIEKPDTMIGWKTLSNPFLQPIALTDSLQFHSTGLYSGIWRWGGLIAPGWLYQSSSITLADSLSNPNLSVLAPFQAGLVHRKSPGIIRFQSAEKPNSTPTSTLLRTQNKYQHRIKLSIRLGKRIRQMLAVQTKQGWLNDTIPLPPFPEGDALSFGALNNPAQALLYPTVSQSLVIPLHIKPIYSDSLTIEIETEQLETGWQVWLYDSLLQQFFAAGQAIQKRSTAGANQRFSLHLIRVPVNNNEAPNENPFNWTNGQLWLKEHVESFSVFNTNGQLIESQINLDSATAIQLPNGIAGIAVIKKGGKQWIFPVFRP